MSSEWTHTSWGDIATLEYGKALRDYQNVTEGYPVYGTNGPIGFHEAPLCKTPGVVIGRKGAYRGVHYSRRPFFVIDTAFYLKPKVPMDMRWAYFSLLTCDINSMDSGSAIPSTSRDEFYKLPVVVPPLAAQTGIAGLLAQFDDRITLLRETNATLEAITQALFKSWFVDFDPVRAKMEGRAPEGMDEATAALFPDALEESELGWVPKGWRVAKVYEVSQVIYGAPFASKLFKAERPGRPLVRIRDLKDERPGVYTEEAHPKGYLLKPGDIAVGMDGEFRAYLWGGEEAWLNQRVCVFQPINNASAAFVRCSIAPLLAAVEASETATTVIHLGKNDIDRFKVVVPAPGILAAFAAVTVPLYSRLVVGKQQAQTLATLRDTLLPRLISGQLRLTEAKEQLEDATA